MKHLFATLLLLASLSLKVAAQSPPPLRGQPMQYFGKDSVIAYYNERYELIDDSCASIVRRGRFNRQTRKFIGSFEDISKVNPRRIVARGTYDNDGLKEGSFSVWYLNGKLQARGKFKGNMLDDIWDFYYPSGKPKLTIDANGRDIKIINAWNEDGRKTVSDGKGKYECVIGPITWDGKINNGRPEGRWMANLTFNRIRFMATEVFKDNVFQQGRNAIGVYSDSSRIHVLHSVPLPIINAEDLSMAFPCRREAGKKFIRAFYPQGREQFIGEISERLTPMLNLLSPDALNSAIQLKLLVLEDGRIVTGAPGGAETKLASALKRGLYDLPNLVPATLDGKPVRQAMMITIYYKDGRYNFTYLL